MSTAQPAAEPPGNGARLAGVNAMRELSPRLRDQLMVSIRDRALIEPRAKALDVEAALRRPFRQLFKADILISAFAVSVMLLVYYTVVGFSLIYLTTVFGFPVKDGNGRVVIAAPDGAAANLTPRHSRSLPAVTLPRLSSRRRPRRAAGEP